MLKVYIEESALNEPQPMEVSPDAPVSHLVPALVEELQLPRTDLFGNRLVYFLRHTDDGRVLPDHFSLRTAGIVEEDCLSLESYVAEGATVLPPPPSPSASLPTGQAAAFYADQTIADATAFAGAKSEAVPPPPLTARGAVRRGGRRWTRRAVLTAGGVTLGLAGIGLAYAGLHAFSNNPATTGSVQGTMPRATMPAQMKPQPTTVQNVVPAHAQAQLVFKQHQQTVRALAWSPDGKTLASGGSDQQLLTWSTGGQVQLNKMQRAAIRALTWSPDGQHLACAAATLVLLFNGQSGMVEGQGMDAHHGLVMALAWSSRQPNLLVSGGLDRLAIVWNTQNFQPMTTFRQHTTGILAVSWAADGQTVGSSSLGGVTRIWNGNSGQQLHGFYEILDQGGNGVALNTLAFQPGGNMLAAGGMDGILRIWTNGLTCQMMGTGATQGQCVDAPQSLNAHTKPLRALAWSPDGRFLATGGDDNMLRIWYPAQSHNSLVSIPQEAPVLALAWSPDGRMLASASGRNVTLWALS